MRCNKIQVSDHAAMRYSERIVNGIGIGDAKDAIEAEIYRIIPFIPGFAGMREGATFRVHYRGITYAMCKYRGAPKVVTIFPDKLKVEQRAR